MERVEYRCGGCNKLVVVGMHLAQPGARHTRRRTAFGWVGRVTSRRARMDGIYVSKAEISMSQGLASLRGRAAWNIARPSRSLTLFLVTSWRASRQVS